jgi:ABC-type transport system substrate-binding protein
MKTPVRALGAVLLVTAALAGCTSSDSSPNPETSVGVGTDLTAQPNLDQLDIAISDKVVTQDADRTADFSSLQILALRAGTLFRLSADGSKLYPYLASSWEYSPDKTSLVATLRSDIKFADGTPITPEDVVATFERSMNNPKNINIGDFTPIKSVTAKGQDVTFTFTRPYASFENIAATYEMAILKASEIGQDYSIPDVPTSSGQYTLSDGDIKGNSFTLTRNTEQPADLQPAVENMAFKVVTDGAGRFTQLKGGQVDVANDIDPATIQSIDSSLKSVGSSTFLIYYMSMNNIDGITSDLDVRKAISLAIDRQLIADVAWGGLAAPNAEFFATTSRWSQGAGETSPQVDAAKELLKGTACENGCSVKLLATGSSDVDQRAATIIQDSLKAIGIDVTIETVDVATVNERIFSMDYEMSMNFTGSLTDLSDGLPTYCYDYDYGLLSCFSGVDSAKGKKLVEQIQAAKTDEELTTSTAAVTAQFGKDALFANLSDYVLTAVATSEAAPYYALGRTLQIQTAPLAP